MGIFKKLDVQPWVSVDGAFSSIFTSQSGDTTNKKGDRMEKITELTSFVAVNTGHFPS